MCQFCGDYGEHICRMKCPICKDFVKTEEFNTHTQLHSNDIIDNGLPPPKVPILDSFFAPDIIEDSSDPESIRQHWAQLRTECKLDRPCIDVVRIRYPNDLKGVLVWLHQRLNKKYKISIGHELLLENPDGSRRIFHSTNGGNGQTTISNEQDFKNFLESDENLHPDRLQGFADSSVRLIEVPATTIYINKTCYIGGVEPYHIWRCAGVSHGGNDKLCFLRSLARFLSPENVERGVDDLLEKFNTDFATHFDRNSFPGVDIELMTPIASAFNVGIQLYSRGKEENAVLVKKICTNQEKIVQLDIQGDGKEAHYSLITDFDQYAKKYDCLKCTMSFPSAWRIIRHKCEKEKEKFTGKSFEPRMNLYERFNNVSKLNIPPPPQRFAVFDVESLLEKTEETCECGEPSATKFRSCGHFSNCISHSSNPCYVCNDNGLRDISKTTFHQKHTLASVSVYSNFTPEPKCIVSDGSPEDLFNKFIKYLEELQDQHREFISNYLSQFKEELEAFANKGIEIQSNGSTALKTLRLFRRDAEKLPVLSFNGSRYDIYVIRKYLFNYEPKTFIVKKQSSYVMISMEKFLFLDILNYLGPNTNYAKFVATFAPNAQQKSHFPYNWFDNLNKLNVPSLPPISAFYNDLSGEDMKDEDYREIEKLWADQNMTTFRDLLMFYNNADVNGFVNAVEKLIELELEVSGLHLLLDGLTLPSIVLKQVLKQLIDKMDDFICSFKARHRDVFEIMKTCMVGGAVIIFSRRQIAFETFLDLAKTVMCQGIVGYDVNALYPFCMMMLQPCGKAIVRRREKMFKADIGTDTKHSYFGLQV